MIQEVCCGKAEISHPNVEFSGYKDNTFIPYGKLHVQANVLEQSAVNIVLKI